MANMTMMYDVTVVGAGMFGSSAAKYIKQCNPSLLVCLIGPKETKDPKQAKIHAAHYDESRVCRSWDRDLLMGELSTRSYSQFRDIEQRTGIPFFHDAGFLAVGSTDRSFVDDYKIGADSGKQQYYVLPTSQALRAKWPYMDFGPEQTGVYTPSHSGFLNPRNFVKAQKELAAHLGCDIIEDIVTSVCTRTTHSLGYFIRTQNGQTFTSKKVLLCTGSFTHCQDLLPTGIQPDIKLIPNAVLRVEIDEKRLSDYEGMPSIVYKGGPWDTPGLNHVAYIVPPIKYPNGKYYLKVGHGRSLPDTIDQSNPQDITNWHWNGGHPKLTEQLFDITRSLFPGLSLEKYTMDHGVTAHTVTGRPYVDLIKPTLGIAIGGCGQGAKLADEIGHIAARMIIKGHWDHDLPQKCFELKAAKLSVPAKY